MDEEGKGDSITDGGNIQKRILEAQKEAVLRVKKEKEFVNKEVGEMSDLFPLMREGGGYQQGEWQHFLGPEDVVRMSAADKAHHRCGEEILQRQEQVFDESIAQQIKKAQDKAVRRDQKEKEEKGRRIARIGKKEKLDGKSSKNPTRKRNQIFFLRV